MKLFLDTNILLDLLLERDGFEESAEIIEMSNEGKCQLFVSSLTMVNIAYVYQKTVGREAIIPNLKLISSLMEVLPLSGDDIERSYYLDGRDFEDTIQAVCATRAGCDCIITRNSKDFEIGQGLGAPLILPAVHTPSSFLKRIQRSGD